MSTVRSVHRSPIHGFSKESADSITLLTGLGVEGDAH
ncbi:MAG: MOSC domain-containing protein, partial [Actinobacteria bacterium]|nr:MOSC domain-containing protein [Actinomycetota bacterium]